MNRRTFLSWLAALPVTVAASSLMKQKPKPRGETTYRPGKLVIESTPGNNDGWFYREWARGQRGFGGQHIHWHEP